jgi:hypothetical protein
MDTKTVIMHYFPYWTLGILMIVATLRSEYSDLMKFDKSAFFKFLKIMFCVTIFRVISMHFMPPTLHSMAPVLQIPLWLTSTVWWEDSAHILPLAIAARFLGDSKIAKLISFFLMLMVQISFGLGHVYQGAFSAILISFAIPYVGKLGRKYGFATTMACHCAYDFITLLTVRLFLGL